ncbi:hypothetical protein [Pseudomonas sp. NPDC089406]|uniref:hypothetical protein n=1 Tax=Pseudomonas sp. NPDC089406 TaxID=3364463 RepID=UPI00384DE6E5
MRIDFMRDQARQFEISVPPDQVTALRVWHCKYKSLKAIEACENLRTLVIATLPDDSIEFLGGLARLEYLRILHMPKLRSLSALAGLEELRCLSLATAPSWDASRKRTVIDALEPLAELPALKHIELLSIVPADRSLEPLTRVRYLESARFSGYQHNEVERFYAITQARNDFVPCSVFGGG